MIKLKPLLFGCCIGATAAVTAFGSGARAVAADPTEASWAVVPDQVLAGMRGGIDLNNLVAYFAIERVVEVDGQVVARAEIVISNLDRLASGGLPTITVTGPLAQIVQIMNDGSPALAGLTPIPSAGAPAASGASAPAASSGAAVSTTGVSGTSPSATAVSPPAAMTTNATAPPSAVASGAGAAPGASVQTASAAHDSGTISSGGTQSGSMTQFGSAISTAVAAAAGATSATGAPSDSTSATSAPAALPSVGSPSVPGASVPVAASAPAHPAGSASPAVAAPVIVVSNLPNATAITTAVQNQVQATTIQTETTITATLNSIPVVNSMALANQIEAQVASSLGH